ncbi:MAG TPA: tail fiber domain-containing protein [Chitinophagales bacterium]|nr:tail fiber domain-containing protein [Chitinophagales bacterium]
MTKLGIGKNCSGSSILEFQVTTAKLTTGGVWTNASDERIKDQKTQLDKEDILAKINALKIERWHYLADAENITHIGPYAQDFYKQFQVGDDSTISTIDPAGVALIGIQALSIQQESTTDQLELLTAENALLRQQLDNLSAIVGALQQDVSMCCASSGSTMGSSALAPALGQNIPNPFTGSTRIPYSIPSGNHTAKMLITHMGTGQIILDEEIDSSKTSMEISAGTLSSGTYSYSLIVDGRIIDTRVMVVQQ